MVPNKWLYIFKQIIVFLLDLLLFHPNQHKLYLHLLNHAFHNIHFEIIELLLSH